MKGLILCGGKGTRLKPFTNSLPKTLLPVAGKPVLEDCIERLVRIGIREIGIVINPYHQVIRNYIGDGKRFGAQIYFIYQNEPKGISHAVQVSQTFLDKESFVLLLGDNLLDEDLGTLITTFQSNESHAALLLAKVESPSDYGIAEIKGNQIIGLEEKPRQPKSDLAVIGAYLFDSTIFQAVQSITPSKRGEYEITDAIQWLINQGKTVSYSMTQKFYSDVGTVERWLKANEWRMQNRFGKQVLLGQTSYVDNCIIKGPVLIGENCTLKNAEIGPYVTIQDGCHLENCRIDRSIVLEKSTIINLGCSITHSAVGKEAFLCGIYSAESKAVQIILGDQAYLNYFTGEGRA
jgi:glucose-1-phosphate thymidylyltransferase